MDIKIKEIPPTFLYQNILFLSFLVLRLLPFRASFPLVRNRGHTRSDHTIEPRIPFGEIAPATISNICHRFSPHSQRRQRRSRHSLFVHSFVRGPHSSIAKRSEGRLDDIPTLHRYFWQSHPTSIPRFLAASDRGPIQRAPYG